MSYPNPSSDAATAVMRGNRRVDTTPEVQLRSALHRRGWRFRKDLLVRAGGTRTWPDIVFTRRRVAVFVDGCFWHRCPTHATSPKANEDYWRPKLEENVQRDRRNTAALEADGWTVLRLWEHTPVEEAVATVEATLEAGAS